MSAPPLERVCTTLLRDVYGSAPAGFSQASLDRAERRLGVALPHTLRAYYAVVGRHRATGEHAAHALIHPDALTLTAEGLAFLVAEQDVASYAVRRADLGKDDPPVFQVSPEDGAWYRECARLSSFLVKNLCWQAVMLLSSQEHTLTPAQWRRATRGMPRVECGRAVRYDADVRRNGALVAIAFRSGRQLHAWAACREGVRVERFFQRAGV